LTVKENCLPPGDFESLGAVAASEGLSPRHLENGWTLLCGREEGADGAVEHAGGLEEIDRRYDSPRRTQVKVQIAECRVQAKRDQEI
jgi:hypothetical protein